MTDELKVTLRLYQGPLDLLLDLIRNQKIDIYDIPIADVTAQYLDYLHLMQEMNVDLASEFLLIASQLIYIKSRLLLPVEPDAPPEEEDPRSELVRRLLEHEKFKNAAQMLHQRELVEKSVWNHPGILELTPTDLEPEFTATLFDMLSVFREVLRRVEDRPSMEVTREEFTVEQMSAMMLQRLEAATAGVSFRILMESFSTRRAVITAFLALLELARIRAIQIGQKDAFGEIHLCMNPKYERSQSLSIA